MRPFGSPVGAKATGRVFSPATSSTQNAGWTPPTCKRRRHAYPPSLFEPASRFPIGCETSVRQAGASAPDSARRARAGLALAPPGQVHGGRASLCPAVWSPASTLDAGGGSGGLNAQGQSFGLTSESVTGSWTVDEPISLASRRPLSLPVKKVVLPQKKLSPRPGLRSLSLRFPTVTLAVTGRSRARGLEGKVSGVVLFFYFFT